MFVVYRGHDEVLITTLENEPQMIQQWIIDGQRDTQDYDRVICRDPVIQIKANMIVYG